MTLYIKNMVCGRCIKAVSRILCDLKLNHGPVLLGEVSIKEDLNETVKTELRERLIAEGFELIDDKKSRLIDQIKRLILEHISKESDTSKNLSDILTSNLHLDYPYISSLFSSIEGIT